jgi:hypothetical protein
VLSAAAAYAAFALLALLGPGLALQRAARVRLDPAFALPLGLVFCAVAWWASLVLHQPWLFPVLIAGADVALLLSWRGAGWSEGPSLRGALPALLALVAVLAASEYPRNRTGSRGEFVFCNIVPEDMAFHAALAWELTVSYPPQVPGLSGVPMGYHNGLPLVRAAAARWAGVRPLDQMSRCETTLMALAMVLLLRSVVRRLGGTPLAVALAGWTLVATDFSFLLGAGRWSEAWLYLTDSNLLFSLVHVNSSVAATALSLCALLALHRFLEGEGRGWLVLAVVLCAAVPQFKAFVGAHLLFGLGVGALVTRRFREALLLTLPALVTLGAVVLGRAAAEMEVVVDPLTIVKRLQTNLGLGGGETLALLLWTLLWLGASLGLRILGLPAAWRSLRSGSLAIVALAAIALSGWPIGLAFRVMPLDYAGWRPPYNEAWYFIEQSAPVLWIFTVIGLGRLTLAGARAIGAGLVAAALTLPSTVQFVWAHRQAPPAVAPPAVVDAMAVLEAAGARGDVVLQKPEPKRYPPPPMVLVGRRVPFTRFIPYLYQVAPRRELLERIELVRRFFKTADPAEARQVAQALQARFVCLYGDDAVAFPLEGLLQPLYEQPNVKVYKILF